MTRKFGRLPRKPDVKTLKFASYGAAFSEPPPAVDNIATVASKLGISDPTVLFPMDGNDQYGDCTIAAAGHAITMFNGLAGKKVIPGASDLESVYFALTNGQDSGCVETDVLDHLQSQGICGERITAYIEVDPQNLTHVKQAIQLFGGLYIGINVPSNMEQQFENGQTLTPGYLTGNGHAVYIANYDADGVTVLTWGNAVKATWGWFTGCTDEVYAILPTEATVFDDQTLAQLQTDLQRLAN